MPLYFLHLTEGDEFTPDLEGVEQDDPALIRKTAMESVGDLIADAVKKGDLDYQGQLHVENEHGQRVLSSTFACLAQIEIEPFQGD